MEEGICASRPMPIDFVHLEVPISRAGLFLPGDIVRAFLNLRLLLLPGNLGHLMPVGK